MNRTISAALVTTVIALTPACAQEQVDLTDKTAIEDIVRAYILENPEIIEDALILLAQREDEADAAAVSEAILANYDAIYSDPANYSIGPADAPVTLVEFFDYRCAYCKRSAEWTMSVPEKYDNQVRVVFKELPILSPESEKAALAAVAAGRQGKYAEFHLALMRLDNQSGFGPEAIDAAAESAGVDVALMRADMRSIPVQKAVSDSKSLARVIGITGTPIFMIGSQNVPGADIPRLEAMIEAELQKLS